MRAGELKVFRRPRVAIVATGDELVEIDETPGPQQIRNSNSYGLAALVSAGRWRGGADADRSGPAGGVGERSFVRGAEVRVDAAVGRGLDGRV